MIENLVSEIGKLEERELRNIEKLFSNYKGEYEKINLDWYNEVGKEIRYNDKSEKSK